METERLRMIGWVEINLDSYFWKSADLGAKSSYKDLSFMAGFAQYEAGPI